MKTSKRTIIVTGGNRGLGLEICRQLALQGQRVILTSRDEALGLAAVKSLNAEKGEILYHPLDVTRAESIADLRDFVIRQFGAADALVNNAAILIDPDARIVEVGADKFQATLDTNLLGPLRLCQAFVPSMLEQGYGRVVNVSSDAGQLSGMVDHMPAYRVSKIALNGLTKILADWVKGTNVLVNAIHPGWVKTDMGGAGAMRSPQEAAGGIVWLATLPDDGPSGGLFRDRRPVAW